MSHEANQITIVTLRIDSAAQAHFDRLRQEHYPPHLNRIAAHLTLFHALPDTGDVRTVLSDCAHSVQAFPMRVNHLMSLGRGVAYAVESQPLIAMHAELAKQFASHLIPQDKQKFRPHIVVQNKTSAPEAKALMAELTRDFAPSEIHAEGFSWWDYLGGPWKLRETFDFAT